MTIEEAAHLLNVELDYPPWLAAIGIGKNDNGADCIYVYTKRTLNRKELSRFSEGWSGFPVVVRNSGPLRLL